MQGYTKEQNVYENTDMMGRRDIARTLGAMLVELTRLRPRREVLRGRLEAALSWSPALNGCRLEVVGSTSWGGDVPQSDLDMVLVTPECRTDRNQAVAILTHLRQCLLVAGGVHEELELIGTASVPILRLHSSGGVHCDVSVDQPRALAHRNLLFRVVAGRPEARDLVRLVKLWLRKRSLPSAAEGGLPSLAWALIAVRVVETRPEGTPLEVLLREFFEEMERLCDHSLCLRRASAKDAGKTFDWQQRGKYGDAWSDDWMQLLSVEDPSDPSYMITHAPMTAALAMLHAVELRLALNAIRGGRWRELWQPLAQQAADRTLHVIFKGGQVCVGQLADVQCVSAMLRNGALHRRDRSSQLGFRVCSLEKGLACVPYAKVSLTERITCQPCHWVCSLPTGPLHPSGTTVLLEEGLARLAEIVQVGGVTRVRPDLCDAVLAWRRTHVRACWDAPLSTTTLSCSECSSGHSHARSEFSDDSSTVTSQADDYECASETTCCTSNELSTSESTDQLCSDTEFSSWPVGVRGVLANTATQAALSASKTGDEDERSSESTCCSLGEASLLSNSAQAHTVTHPAAASKPTRLAVEWKPTLQSAPVDMTTKITGSAQGSWARWDKSAAEIDVSMSLETSYKRDTPSARRRGRRGRRSMGANRMIGAASGTTDSTYDPTKARSDGTIAPCQNGWRNSSRSKSMVDSPTAVTPSETSTVCEESIREQLAFLIAFDAAELDSDDDMDAAGAGEAVIGGTPELSQSGASPGRRFADVVRGHHALSAIPVIHNSRA